MKLSWVDVLGALLLITCVLPLAIWVLVQVLE